MKFEVGKYYKHVSGKSIKIIGVVSGSVYCEGPAFVAEYFGSAEIALCGMDETAATGFSECPPWVVRGDNVFEA